MGKDQHPRNAHPKTIPFSHVLSFYDDSALLFYFYMKVNGHKILVSTNTAKLSRILLRWFKGNYYASRFLEVVSVRYLNPSFKEFNSSLFILGKIDFDYFGKRIGDLSKGSPKYS